MFCVGLYFESIKGHCILGFIANLTAVHFMCITDRGGKVEHHSLKPV